MSVLSCSSGSRDRCESFDRGMGRSIVASGDDGAPVSTGAPYHLNRFAVLGARPVDLGLPDGSGTGPPGVSCRGTLQLPTSSTSRRGGYSCGFDLRLDPKRLDHVGALKRLSTEEHDLEDSQQTIDSTGKDVGNCKPVGLSITHIVCSRRR